MLEKISQCSFSKAYFTIQLKWLKWCRPKPKSRDYCLAVLCSCLIFNQVIKNEILARGRGAIIIRKLDRPGMQHDLLSRMDFLQHVHTRRLVFWTPALWGEGLKIWRVSGILSRVYKTINSGVLRCRPPIPMIIICLIGQESIVGVRFRQKIFKDGIFLF